MRVGDKDAKFGEQLIYHLSFIIYHLAFYIYHFSLCYALNEKFKMINDK